MFIDLFSNFVFTFSIRHFFSYFQLVSPEDLVNASRQFESLNLPLRYFYVQAFVLVIHG